MAVYDEEERKKKQYQSTWSEQINDTVNQILNRKPFEYDINTDKLYQQYKDMYETQGKLAMEDTVGKVTSLTGGYGNSYAQSAGQQAYQDYMNQLNSMVPDLYNMALSKYQAEGDALYAQLSTLAQQDATAYDRFLADRDYEYQQGRDEAADKRYEQEWLYQQAQDKLSQENWQQQFDYNKAQDALAQQNWLQQFLYGKEQDALAQENWQLQFDYGKQQDALAQQNWLQQFQYGKDQDAQAYQQWLQQFQYGQQQDALAQQNWQKQFDEALRQWNAQYGDTTGSNSGTQTDPGTQAPSPAAPETGYAGNSGLTKEQVKEMQDWYGTSADGQWGPNSTKAAGGRNAEDAWAYYQQQKNKGSVEPDISSYDSAAQYLRSIGKDPGNASVSTSALMPEDAWRRYKSSYSRDGSGPVWAKYDTYQEYLYAYIYHEETGRWA